MACMFQSGSLKCSSEKEHFNIVFSSIGVCTRVWWSSSECLIFCKPAKPSFSCLFSGRCDVSRWAGLYKALNNGTPDLRHHRDCGVVHITKDKKKASVVLLWDSCPAAHCFLAWANQKRRPFLSPLQAGSQYNGLKWYYRVPQVYHTSWVWVGIYLSCLTSWRKASSASCSMNCAKRV